MKTMTKLRTVHKVSGIGGSVTRDSTDYLGNLVMRNGHLDMYQFDGGYVSFSNDTIDGWHYYIQDYMGNNRLVVRDSIIEQITHYYPYGGVIGDISTNENVQKYKFEGPRSHQKEIDNLLARRRAFRRGVELDRTFGLDNYDIHARQYFSMMPTWDRVDNKAEDYYHLSPYSYCAGNPVNLGDYDGMDIWEIDNEGRIRNHIEDTTQDAFYMVELNDSGEYERTFTIDEDGNIVYNSISFAYGTVESQKSISCSPNNKYVDKYDIYQVRGDENGKALFEFFGRNVAENRIEVGHIMCGVEGEKGLNFVLNSHHKPEYYVEDGVKHIRSSEPATPELYNKRLRYGYHIRAFIHSHPNSDKPSKADMIFKQLVENNYIRLGSKTPATKIWVVSSGLFISFFIFIMRTIISFILLCTFCSLYSQIEKTVESIKRGVYYGTLSFTIPQYVIADTVIANELDSIFQSHGFSPEDGSKILFSLRTQKINDDSTEYDFFFNFTPSFLETGLGYFKIRGVDVIVMDKILPPFLRKTKSKKRFTYKRQYYSWVENGETIEFDISYEDDGSVYTLILKDGHFTVDRIQGVEVIDNK